MDPYYEWLGIAAEEQPPDHYRLLGINVFESNPQVIESAFNQRIAYLQQLSGDQDSVDDAQRIMSEIARARLVLLNKQKKSAYDKSLRNKRNQQSVRPPPTPQQRVAPSTESRELGVKRSVSQNAGHFKSVLKIDKRFLILLPVVALLVFVGIIASLSFNNENSGSKVSDKPQDERTATSDKRTVTDDSRPITVQPNHRRQIEPSAGNTPKEPTRQSTGQDDVVKRQDAEAIEKTKNPFIIGSKRDESAGSTLPSATTAITGDNEDRVRMIINGNEVQFAFDDEGKRQRVSLVGSFNSWNSASTPMRRENRHWKVSKRLAPIRHEFKFVSGNGDWYPEDDNLILDLENREGVVQSNSFELAQRPARSEALVEVSGEHQGRVEVIPTKKGVRFLYRDPLESDYVLLVGDFNSWNTTVAGMRREGSVWTAEKAIAPGNYAFKFLGPGERWFPKGDNLTLSYSERVPATRSLPESTKPSTSSSIPATTESRIRESDQSISIQRAREYLNDAGLYEGKPGVWFFPQSNRLVIRQYGRISKDPKIKKALKRLGDRLPHPAEMGNPPPQRR